MKKDKKKVIIIAAVIAIIVCILVVGVVLFLTTDFLKSDQDLFFKYLAQNVEVVEQYLEDPNKTDMGQIKSEPYTVISNVTFDLVSSDPNIANQTTPPRNFSIAYTKNADPQNNRDFSEAKLKFLTKELLTAQYAHDGDIYALNGVNEITSSKILNIYLGIENNDLKQLAQKLGIQDVSNIPNRIDNVSLADLLNLTTQEKEYIQNSVVKVISTQIPKDKYYHNKGEMIEIDTKQVQTNSYGITLTSEELKNVVIAILNEVSQDETILNMLLQKIMLVDSETDMTTNTIRQQIQEKISQINTQGFSNGITIEVYEADGKVVRTKIEKNTMEYYIFDHERANNSIRTMISLNYTYQTDNTNVEPDTVQQINDNMNVNNENYQVIEGSATEQLQQTQPENPTYTIKNIEFAKQISGTQNNMIAIVTCEVNNEIIKVTLQNKTEQNASQNGFINNIVVHINNSDTTYFTIKANSNIAPSSTVSVQELNDTNSAVLNNRTPENITQLLNAIQAQLQKIYNQLMQVAEQVQEQENAQNGLNTIDTNVAEANTITNRTDVVGE